jgi:hypothetical protein
MKKCRSCNQEKNLSQFYKRADGKNGKRSQCKNCLSYKKKLLKVEQRQFKWEDKVLTLKNYKEPLTKVKNGYGWYGTIACTIDGKEIQCHICGALVQSLTGHIKTHEIKTREYKEKFKLQYTSALISESTRMKYKQKTLDFIKSLTEEEKKEYWRKCKSRLNEARRKRGSFQPKKTLEQMNKEDSCPEQTLEKIKIVKEKIGHVPSKDEFISEMNGQRYTHLAYKHFGSWNKAIEMCHFNSKDDKRSENMGGYKGKKRYSDEELLEYLKLYVEENRQIPTISDFRRGLLPDYNRYIERFGNIENARQLAGVYLIVDEHESVFQKNKSKYFRKKLI